LISLLKKLINKTCIISNVCYLIVTKDKDEKVVNRIGMWMFDIIITDNISCSWIFNFTYKFLYTLMFKIDNITDKELKEFGLAKAKKFLINHKLKLIDDITKVQLLLVRIQEIEMLNNRK